MLVTQTLSSRSNDSFKILAGGTTSITPCVYVDAAFGSVVTATKVKKELGCDFIGLVKCAHRMYPKKEMNFHLSNLPAGSKLVMQAEVDGVSLIAVGYNYKHVNMIMTAYNGF